MVEAAGAKRPAATWQARALRSAPVRIVLAILFVAGAFAVVAVPFNVFVADKAWKRVGALLLGVVVLGAYAAYVRLVERRAVTELGRAGAPRELGLGLLVGALLLSLTIGVLWALGAYQVTGSKEWAAMLATLPGFIMAGILEEVLVRGILFRIIEQSLGSWIALAVSAVIFGLLHLLNPGTTLLSAGAIAIEAGVLLAAAFMITRRLWLCIGIHIAWNFTQGGVFSSAVSGGRATGLLQGRLVGQDWLTGGAFGVEASVVALGVCSAAGIFALGIAARRGAIVRPFWSRGIGAANAV
jgi:membrane protease YdiL (CAAX protease family)